MFLLENTLNELRSAVRTTKWEKSFFFLFGYQVRITIPRSHSTRVRILKIECVLGQSFLNVHYLSKTKMSAVKTCVEVLRIFLENMMLGN